MILTCDCHSTVHGGRPMLSGVEAGSARQVIHNEGVNPFSGHLIF